MFALPGGRKLFDLLHHGFLVNLPGHLRPGAPSEKVLTALRFRFRLEFVSGSSLHCCWVRCQINRLHHAWDHHGFTTGTWAVTAEIFRLTRQDTWNKVHSVTRCPNLGTCTFLGPECAAILFSI